jgi:hypothetical protein
MKADQPNAILVKFEQHIALGPTLAAKLLGLPYVSYAQYRSGTRTLKTSHIHHVQVLMLLDRATLETRINEVVHDL